MEEHQDMGLQNSEMIELVNRKFSRLNIYEDHPTLGRLQYEDELALVPISNIIGGKLQDFFERHFIKKETKQSEYVKQVDNALDEFSQLKLALQIKKQYFT